MSTVAEIQAALPNLTDQELLAVERALHAIYRQRKTGIVYDDSYGVITEADILTEAAEDFRRYDQEETEKAHVESRCHSST